MVRVPGAPGFWVFVAAAQVIPAFYLPGNIVWPTVPIIALSAMTAAVTRAYQDVAQLRTEEESSGGVSGGGPRAPGPG
ncbi:hypothetical protein Aple_033610 [Acrocarpospora pleiomorpha]|uniref:Uncharacterized protein n=1 Tax=Acrocarpospora pleiomorpha TaxID=90975 RepID=A0A5M3XFU2_9ACTN|nr:hypothetical protein [Acrocarpospora pleiomorpha]GES20465.1 hypothetical protein Aple_033610 [Acrocarpospora pleiomorpha]